MGSRNRASQIHDPFGKQKVENYSTQYSHVVTHQSTNWAIASLTSEIERDPVCSGMYGRSWCRERVAESDRI